MPRVASSLTVVALLVCALVVAACGSSSSSSGSATAAATNQAATFQKFQQCLKDHGVTMPTGPPQGGAGGYGPPPGAGAGGAPPSGATPGATPGAGGFGGSSAFRKAMQACRQYRPQGAQRFGNRNGFRPNAKVFTAYLTCLKDHGAKVDPTQGFRALSSLDRSSATVRKALDACVGKLPQRPAGPPSTATPPGTPGTSTT